MSCKCPNLGDTVPELTAIVHVLEESVVLPVWRCVCGFMFGIVEALEELSEVVLRQLTIGVGDFQWVLRR